jgi:hypothetical protein
MQAQAISTPRRRGRPRKTINPQFPGIVVPITSKPRLRVGCICEIRASRSPQNIGIRCVIIGIYPDGDFRIEALSRPILTLDTKTGEVIPEPKWLASIKPEQLYRIGVRP